MRLKSFGLATMLILGVVLGVFGSQVGAQGDQGDEPIIREELAKRSLQTADGQQARVIRVTLAPGVSFADVSEEPMATYPAEEFVYILEGSGVVARDDGETRIEAGDLVYNERGQPHSVANANDEEPLTFVAVWIGDEGDL